MAPRDRPHADAQPKAVLVSGHLVDAPDRTDPRFPGEEVPRVAREVAEVLRDWAVGPATTVLCGGARGADIVAAEEGLARGAHVVVCLALPPDEFERRSVGPPGGDWSRRFRRLLDAADVRQLAGATAHDGDEAFVRANTRLVELARALDPRPHVLVVWDGVQGDGPGGTADLVRRFGYGPDDPRLHVIDPSPRR